MGVIFVWCELETLNIAIVNLRILSAIFQPNISEFEILVNFYGWKSYLKNKEDELFWDTVQ